MTPPPERGLKERKRIRVPCAVDLISGLYLRGYTKEISLDGVYVESQGFSLMGRNPPQPGDSGGFTLFYRRGSNLCHIKMQCMLTSVVSNGLGLNINYSGLTHQDQQMLMEILKRGSDQVDL